jgi:hypothetical protein
MKMPRSVRPAVAAHRSPGERLAAEYENEV